MATASELYMDVLDKSYDKDGNIIINTALLDYLEAQYTPDIVPQCRVCGADLGIVSMGGGHATVYACNATKMSDPDWQEHYGNSKWTQYRTGDSLIVAVVSELRKQVADAD